MKTKNAREIWTSNQQEELTLDGEISKKKDFILYAQEKFSISYSNQYYQAREASRFYQVERRMYCFQESLPASRPPPVPFSPPKAPPISAPFVGIFTFTIPQSLP